MLNSYLSTNPDTISNLKRHLNLQNVLTELLVAAPDAALPRILQAICTHTDWDFGEVWNIDTSTNSLVHQASWQLARYPKFEEISRQITFSPGLGLPGRVWKTISPIWVPDVVEDVNFLRASFAQREGLHSGVGIPLHSGEGVLGVMTFFSQEVRSADPDLLALFERLGHFVGLFIERQNAELIEREKIRQESAFQERQRLAQGMQNLTVQELFPMAVAAHLLPVLWENNHMRLWFSLNELRTLTEKTLASSHQFLAEFPQPLFLDPLLATFKPKIHADLSVTIRGAEQLPVNVRVAIYCIVQEALENVVRHAFATRVKFTLTADQGINTLQIIDNGKGFDINNILPDRLGIKIMRGCAESVASKLEIMSSPNQGTQIFLTWRNV